MIVEPPKTIEEFNKIKSTIVELMQNKYADERMIEKLQVKLSKVQEQINLIQIK